MVRLSLLLVEDDTSLLEELRLFLGDFFDIIETAVDAETAYDKFIASPYDLVITDIQLPRQNGLMLVEKIKKRAPLQTVIVISAYKEVDYFLKSIELGIYSFLIKPFDSQQLINTMIKVTSHLQHQHHHEDCTMIRLMEDITFDIKTKALHVKGSLQELTEKEELLLTLLAKNINNFVGNEQITQEIWHSSDVNSSTLRALIKRVRDKLCYDDSIVNLTNRGYKLTAKLE